MTQLRPCAAELSASRKEYQRFCRITAGKSDKSLCPPFIWMEMKLADMDFLFHERSVGPWGLSMEIPLLFPLCHDENLALASLMALSGYTVHGFRTIFKTTAECKWIHLPFRANPTLLFNVLEFVILHNSGKIALANKATEALNGPRVQQKNQNENKTPNVKGNALIAVIPLQHS